MNSLYAFPAESAGIPVEATITGGDSQQDGLAVVSCVVSAAGGTGNYTYAWTLRDPRGVDRTVLLSSTTVANPTFTPDLTGGGGQWVARCTVTSGAASVVAVKVVTVGIAVTSGPNWIEVFAYESDGSASASPSGGSPNTLSFGGLTWTVVNADGASGPKVDAGDLSITPNAAAPITGTSIANVGALRISLSALTGLSTIGTRRLMICAEIEGYTPSTTDEGFTFGLEVAGAGFGAGATGRAVGAGQGFSSTLRRSRVHGQVAALLRTAYSTANATPARSFAAIFDQSGVMVYSANVAGTFDTPGEVIASTPINAGSADPPVDYNAYNQFFIGAYKQLIGAVGAEWRLAKFKVLVC